MEFFTTNNTVGFRTIKNNNIIQIEINKNKDFITININENQLLIDRDYIITYITPNFSVEMLYYILCEFLKSDYCHNYKLIEDKNYYIFEGYYTEHFDQGETIYIKLLI